MEKIYYKCIVYMKERVLDPDLGFDYLPSYEFYVYKEDLNKNFIHLLYDLFENNWDSFDTLYYDTGKPALDIIKNTYHLKRYKVLSWQMIKMKRKKACIKVRQGRVDTGESFYYILYFKNSPFFKIGKTTNPLFRLFGYIYEFKNNLSKFEIDFDKSFCSRSFDNIEEEIIKKISEKPIFGREWFDKKFYECALACLSNNAIKTFSSILNMQSSSEFVNELQQKNISITYHSFTKNYKSINFNL